MLEPGVAVSLSACMYYLVFGFLYLLSLLPLRVLYLFSDLAYLIVYHTIKYRKAVVLHNLSLAFPQKTADERRRIAKQFYKNFCDTFIESVKFISADDQFFKKHFTGNYDAIENLYASGRSVQAHLGHNFNWELANFSVPTFISYPTLVVYLPQNNKLFDRLFRYIRSRKGAHLIAATNFNKELQPYRHTQYLIALIADQNPAHPNAAYWINFFGHPTPFLRGPEKNARRNDLPVVFCSFTRKRRGYYEGHAELAALHVRDLPPGELTKRYAAFLERMMTQHPEMWLWSHRRWKWKWKPEYGPVLS
jgi:Kdo2-lipid IVA lauroyltransferase/acyltransferase